MNLDSIEVRLAVVFRKAGKSKVLLEEVQESFSRACPELNNEPNRRSRLCEALEKLAAENVVALPVNRKKDWQTYLKPALPNWIRVIRDKQSLPISEFDHARFPWVPEMRFISKLSSLLSPTEARQLHEFFKNGGSERPIVPTKERSWQIFGYEKRLEQLVGGKLFFGSNRLTLEMLRCRPVSYSLVYHLSPNPAEQSPIILENEATFHSFVRLNAVKSIYAAVIFGNGQAVLKGMEFLAHISQAVNHKNFLYFGDLDASGIRIPADLAKQLSNSGIRINPDEYLYQELLAVPYQSQLRPEKIPATHLCWFSKPVAMLVDERLQQSGRVAQEALGWERLSKLFTVDASIDFLSGF